MVYIGFQSLLVHPHCERGWQNIFFMTMHLLKQEEEPPASIFLNKMKKQNIFLAYNLSHDVVAKECKQICVGCMTLTQLIN